jgi:hypothetical protein
MLRNYEQTPHALTRDTNLSLGARALYPLLRDMAWVNGRRKQDDAVELPSMDVIAETIGCAPSTCRTYVSELRATGWVETVRASRRRPSLWIIRDDPSAPKSGGLAGSECAEKASPSAPKSDIRTSSCTDTSDKSTPPNPPAGGAVEVVDLTRPPALQKQEVPGEANLQDIALNALCEVCGIDLKGNGVLVAVTAMNGKASAKGIRELYWIECQAVAAAHGDAGQAALARLHAHDFEEHLAAKIRAKAATIRERQPWRTTLSPIHVRDLWLDIELQPEPQRGLSSARMENL